MRGGLQGSLALHNGFVQHYRTYELVYSSRFTFEKKNYKLLIVSGIESRQNVFALHST